MLLETDAQERLENENNVLNKLGIRRGLPRVEIIQKQQEKVSKVPEAIKDLAAVLSQTEGSTKVADAFGMKPSTVRYYKTGHFDGTHKIDVDRKQANDEKAKKNIDALKDSAIDRAMAAVKQITDGKLEGVSALDASTIAKNMTAVIDKLTPKDGNINVNGNVIFIRPRTRAENEYEVVSAKPA